MSDKLESVVEFALVLPLCWAPGSGAPEYQQQSRTCNRMPCVPVDRILNRMSVSFDQDIHRHLPHGCVMGRERGPRAVRDTETNDMCQAQGLGDDFAATALSLD